MEVSAKYVTPTKFEVTARGHRTICDQPAENNGSDEGMDPPEFLLASLATCSAYYAAQYLTARGLDADGLNVKVTAEKEKHPAHLTSFHIFVGLPDLEVRHHIGMRRAVESCLIHNTLQSSPDIEITLDTGAPRPGVLPPPAAA
ncbi:MAG TPA: OsmC family protein [Bryobacteraceae bacterium]|nr:OsmC family protein [Bryobacteraceae bacterium]